MAKYQKNKAYEMWIECTAESIIKEQLELYLTGKVLSPNDIEITENILSKYNIKLAPSEYYMVVSFLNYVDFLGVNTIHEGYIPFFPREELELLIDFICHEIYLNKKRTGVDEEYIDFYPKSIKTKEEIVELFKEPFTDQQVIDNINKWLDSFDE